MSYRSKNQNQFLHPFTFFIVSAITEIYETMKADMTTRATKKLYFFLYFLDPVIKKVLAPELAKMDNMLKGMSKVTREDFLGILDKIMTSLHVAGYFAAAKWGPTTKTTTLKELEMKIREAVYEKEKREESENKDAGD
ncbi:MAG: hypothetical protein E3J73_02775 [Candidatus Bathyarchaeum sp.]|nr:MAG: hypothetical protein E3J73_02775 [Candidatus Bathyarchaeum sp.]